MAKEYVIIIKRTGPETFGAFSPDVPGCVVTAHSPEEARRVYRQALTEHLTLLRSRGEPVPEPSSVIDRLEVD